MAKKNRSPKTKKDAGTPRGKLSRIQAFRAQHDLEGASILHPIKILKATKRIGLLDFLIVGVTGVMILLITTWLLTHYVFGVEQYFTAYLIGLTLNLIYNFALHTIRTFKTKEKHWQRFIYFIAYSLIMAWAQANIIKTITDAVGAKYYLIVIATTIACLSVVTFLFFKLLLFKEQREKAARRS